MDNSHMFDIYLDGFYGLDLACWEHREVARHLIQLAFVEPGDNWQQQFYYNSIIEDCSPGWSLPLSWYVDF